MKEKLKEILEGFFNLLTKDPAVLPLVEKRSLICAKCNKNVDNFCAKDKGGCGCYLPAKVSSPKSKCPDKLW